MEDSPRLTPEAGEPNKIKLGFSGVFRQNEDTVAQCPGLICGVPSF